MSIMAKTPSGYKKIGSAYLGERPVDKVFNANGDVVYALQRELTGVPPLLFKGKEQSELLNYRIYGDTVDGNSVGDLVESGEHAGEYKVPVTVEGKNLLQNTATSQTINGVTLTVNADKSITCNGTATNTIFFAVKVDIVLESGTYVLTGCPLGGGQNTFRLYAQTDGGAIFYMDNGAGAIINYTSKIEVLIAIYSGQVCNNLIFYPMIRKADIADDTYELYHAPVTTPIYLPEPLKMVGDEAEYIDYAEQKRHVDADEEIEKQATAYMVSITPKTDVSKIVFVTMSSVPDDCTILKSGLIFTLDEADANTLNSTNYADGVRGNASTAHNYRYTWTKKYTEGQTIYIRSYVKYQTADNEIEEVYGNVYKADINGFERVRKNLQTINAEFDVTLPALPTLPGTNVLSVGTAVQPSRMDIKGRIKSLT